MLDGEETIGYRIKQRKLSCWADHAKRHAGEFNTRDGGRDRYFEDPSGDLPEILSGSA